jgi:flavodoxin
MEVYYFSGTGNSLFVARQIAEKTHGTLLSIPAVMGTHSIQTDADALGIVFPAYHAQLFGIPLIVERFVNKLEDIGSKYLFAVCTCGAHEHFNGLPTLKNLEKIIKSKGGKLSAEFSIQLPMNSLNYSHVPFINQNQDIMFNNCTQKIESICQCITTGKTSKYTLIPSLLNVCMTPLYFML